MICVAICGGSSYNMTGLKANISDTEAPFLDLHLSVANGFVSSKIYDKAKKKKKKKKKKKGMFPVTRPTLSKTPRL